MTQRTYTFDGPRAAETARGALSNVSLPQGPADVQIEINSTRWDAVRPTTVAYNGPDPETGLRNALQGAENLEEATYISLEIAEDNESVQESEPPAQPAPHRPDGGVQCVSVRDSDDDRELRELSADTNPHTLLCVIAERDGYVSTDTLREESELNRNSVSPAASTLWKRKHVERRQTKSATHEYEYQLSEHGRAEYHRLEGKQ